MNTQKTFKAFLMVLALPLMVGCAPSFHAETAAESLVLGSTGEEGLLSKTSTGNQVLQEMERLRTQGYSLEIRHVATATLQSLNAKLSTFHLSGRSATIFIDETLELAERAHALAHEISRLKDELDIEDYLRNHPRLSDDVRNFWDLYGSKGLLEFDWNVVKFAVGVSVCKEARAYLRNQSLSAEGLPTTKYLQKALGKYLSETTLPNLDLILRTLIEAQVENLCSKYSSMTELQSSLAW